MQTKPVVKLTITTADLKQQPGMAVTTDVKAGRGGRGTGKR